MSDLDELRAEHAERVIGPRLAALLARVVRATAPVYPAREYSPASAWDEPALEDALQDWVEARLLRRGDLPLLLASAQTMPGLRSLLTRSFTQHLVNQRRRTSATNLFARTARLLRTDRAFQLVHAGTTTGDDAYRLAAEPTADAASADSVQALLKVAAALSDDDLGVVRYGPYSLKSSPILRDPQLADLVRRLLAHADGYLTVAQMLAVMVHRFNLAEPNPTSLDDAAADTRADVEATAESHLIARTVLARLGPDRVRLLRALVDADGDARAAATAAGGVTTAQLTEVADAVHALIANHADHPDEAVAIFRALVESLYLQDDRR